MPVLGNLNYPGFPHSPDAGQRVYSFHRSSSAQWLVHSVACGSARNQPATPFNFDTLATTLLSFFPSPFFQASNFYRTPPTFPFFKTSPTRNRHPTSLHTHTHTPHRNNGSFSGFVFESFKEVQVVIPPISGFVRSLFR